LELELEGGKNTSRCGSWGGILSVKGKCLWFVKKIGFLNFFLGKNKKKITPRLDATKKILLLRKNSIKISRTMGDFPKVGLQLVFLVAL
jgi:hypothetical protein